MVRQLRSMSEVTLEGSALRRPELASPTIEHYRAASALPDPFRQHPLPLLQRGPARQVPHDAQRQTAVAAPK